MKDRFYNQQRVRLESQPGIWIYGTVTQVGNMWVTVLWDGENKSKEYWGNEANDIQNLFQSKQPFK